MLQRSAPRPEQRGRMSRPTPARREAQASRRSRITTPMRGFGAKDVDLRGIRIAAGGGRHHLGDRRRVHRDHDARAAVPWCAAPGRGCGGSRSAPRPPPTRAAAPRAAPRRPPGWSAACRSTAQARPSETTNAARVGVAGARRAARRTPPPGPGSRPNSSPRSAETSCRSDMVSAATERWIGPICSGWSLWSTSSASPWSHGELPSAAAGSRSSACSRR